MQRDEAVRLFDYLYWVRDTIFRATGRLEDETFRTIRAEASARDLRTTLASLSEHWRRDEIEMRAWLSGLSDADLTAPPHGATDRLPLSDYLIHVVGHAIEEFTEAALLLRHAGSPPDAIEFLEFADPRSDPTPK